MAPILALTRRMLHERRRLLLWVCVGGAFTVVITAAMYSAIGDQYGKTFENLPEAVLNLFGGGDMGTPEGFLETELLSFVAPGLVLGIAIAFGAGTLAGSEHAGHLSLVYTAPISRTRIALASLFATTVAVIAISVVLWGSLLVGNTVGSLHISIGRLSAAALMLGLLGVAGGALAFGIGAASGARGLAAGVTSAVVVASYLIYALAPLSTTLEPLRYVSIWYPFTANHPLTNGVSIAHALVLVGFAVVVAAGGIFAFGRRDVHG